MTKPPFEYRAAVVGAQHWVFVVHDETPEWWRHVATFYSAERAAAFTEVENDMAADDPNFRAGDDTPAPELPPAPPPSVTIERVRSVQVSDRTTVTQTDWDAVDGEIRKWWPTEMSVAEIARRTGISSPTVHKHARDMGLGPRGVTAPKVDPVRVALDPARGDAIMRVAMTKPPMPLKAIVGNGELSKEADDLWLFVSDLDGEVKQSEWSAESGIAPSILKTATAELTAAGIMVRVATGALTVSSLHPKSEAAKEPEEEAAPPTGCLLNSLEIVRFRAAWSAGDSMREMAEQFSLTTIEVADTRKKLGLPNRAESRLST